MGLKVEIGNLPTVGVLGRKDRGWDTALMQAKAPAHQKAGSRTPDPVGGTPPKLDNSAQNLQELTAAFKHTVDENDKLTRSEWGSDLLTLAKYWQSERIGGSDGIASRADLEKLVDDPKVPTDLRPAAMRITAQANADGFDGLDTADRGGSRDGKFSDDDLAVTLAKFNLMPQQTELVQDITDNFTTLAGGDNKITQSDLHKLQIRGDVPTKDLVDRLSKDPGLQFILDTAAQRSSNDQDVDPDGTISMADIAAVKP